ncbi:metal-sulfur cluster assembly factor [archaeon]|nr:metal-sulfur cluster assembly factor [archaeon]
MTMKEEVMTALEGVLDPELGISIVDMGLIYKVEESEGSVTVDMTLTNPACPLAAMIVNMVEDATVSVKGVQKVRVNLVFDPPWTPERIKGWQGKK